MTHWKIANTAQAFGLLHLTGLIKNHVTIAGLNDVLLLCLVKDSFFLTRNPGCCMRSSEDDILFWGEGAYGWLGFEEG